MKGGKGKENVAQADPANGAGGTKHDAKVERTPVPRSEVVLPLEPWTLVHALWRGEKMHPSRIVDVRVAKGELVAVQGQLARWHIRRHVVDRI